MPASATRVATCWCWGVETSVDGVAGSGWSNTPESKIANRIRRSMSSRREAGIFPEVKSAAVRPEGIPGSAGRSTPASAAATGSRTAKPTSGTTNPFRPPPCLRSPSVAGFWQLGRPLIWL